jgi:LemA protein
MWLYILIVIGAILLLYIAITYNTFIKLRNKVNEAFATMDVYLKKRWDLIPNIVQTIKGYAQHEKETFEQVTLLRSGVYEKMTLEDKIDTNEQLTAGISKLIAVAEKYPDLKANQNFLDLSKQLSKIEDEIANARKYYNAVVRLNNNKVQMFPSNLIAGLFGFKEKKMFEATASEREITKIELL